MVAEDAAICLNTRVKAASHPTLPLHAAPSQSPLTARASAHRRWVLAAAMMAMFMAAVESTIVSTAMPTIVAELGGFHLLSWVFAAYLLTQAVTIPVYGRLADLYGRKRMLFIGAGVFLAGSALCGFAWDMPSLVVFRALQGLGAGAIMPISTTIVGDIYPPEERGHVQGYISAIWGISAVIGPLLGAVLVQHLGWETIFWVNLPVGAASIALLAATFHETPQSRQHRIDYLGSVLLMGGSGALILALVQASELGRDAVAGLLAVAVLALAGLLLHERRAAEPMMPLDLWRHRVITAINLGALVTGAAMMAIVVFLPTYVQGIMGRSALTAGFALTSMSIGWPLGSTVSGRMMAKSSYRGLTVIGGLGLVAGSVLLILLTPARGPFWAMAGAFFTGLGMGFCNTTFVVAAQGSVGWDRRGLATSTVLFMRMLGQALGAALFGGILNAGLSQRLPEASAVVERLMEPAERATLRAAAIARLTEAAAAALHQVFLVSGLLALVALVLAFLLPAGHGARQARRD